LLVIASVKALPLVVFGFVLAITLGITYWASKRTRSATDFWAAGRGISPLQNGLAISGDYMSAAAFLGVSGLIFLDGFDGYSQESPRCSRSSPYSSCSPSACGTRASTRWRTCLPYRLNERPARTAAAVGTICVVAFYLVAQMIAAGALIEALTELKFVVAVLVTGGVMLAYVIFGGMIATTWVQIIKAVLLLSGVVVLAIWALGKVSFNPSELMGKAASASGEGDAYLSPGLLFVKPLDSISTGLAFALGTLGLPHILMRFFTVPNARASRGSAGWAVVFIGSFYILVMLVGLGSRALLTGPDAETLVGDGGNLAAPYLAQLLGGGEGSAGGDIFFAVISAVAFATILAVVAGLVIAASGAMAHDFFSNVVRRAVRPARRRRCGWAGWRPPSSAPSPSCWRSWRARTSTSSFWSAWPSPWPPARTSRPCCWRSSSAASIPPAPFWAWPSGS
jgi:cation/acetate symporter